MIKLKFVIVILVSIMAFPFTAVAGDWKRDSIETLTSRGITSAAEYEGRLDGALSCDAAARLVCAAFGLTDSNCLEYVRGITGDAASTNVNITRERFMHWAAQLSSLDRVSQRYADASVRKFADYSDIAPEYFGEAARLSADKIVSGYGDGKLLPKRDITVGEALTVLANIVTAERFPYENPQDIIITQPDKNSRVTDSSSISILGACDFDYPLFMNGEEIQTTARGFFSQYVKLAEGENTFVFLNNGKEETIVITRKDSEKPQPSKPVYYDNPIYGVITLNYVSHRAEPDENPILLTPLAKGTTFALLGEIDDYYIIADGTYVYKAAIEAFEGEAPEAAVKGATVTADGGFTYLTLETTGNPLYSLARDGNNVLLAIQAGDKSAVPDYSGAPIASITKSAEGRTSKYEITFSEPPIGHYVEFSDGRMLVGFKHAAKSLAEATIIIDAGHGGEDPGALGPPGSAGLMEKDFNLMVAEAARSYLESKGAHVLMIRSDDTFVSLADRVSAILNGKPDISVSVHSNSMPLSSDFTSETGPLMFYTFDTSSNAAGEIHKYVTDEIGFAYKEPRRENFALTRITNCPAILFEMSFLCNPSDYESLLIKAQIETLGEALGKGIERYLQGGK